jgi:Arylsulfotransferase (ASST)
VLDVFHCNSIDVDPESGNLLVSARSMDSVFYVARPSGKVLWKMGGATFSKDGATYVSVADPFFRQHDARLQPGWCSTCGGGTGQVSVFDDETAKSAPARAVVYDLIVGVADGAASADGGYGDSGASHVGTTGTATVAWMYEGLSSSAFAGDFRIYPDGSRVIGWGVSLTTQLVFAEVDAYGNDLVDFGFADSEPSYRAIKVPLSTFDLDLLRRTAGLP